MRYKSVGTEITWPSNGGIRCGQEWNRHYSVPLLAPCSLLAKGNGFITLPSVG